MILVLYGLTTTHQLACRLNEKTVGGTYQVGRVYSQEDSPVPPRMLQGMHNPIKLFRVKVAFRKLKLVFLQYIILHFPLYSIPTPQPTGPRERYRFIGVESPRPRRGDEFP